jgi:hypothetical protein
MKLFTQIGYHRELIRVMSAETESSFWHSCFILLKLLPQNFWSPSFKQRRACSWISKLNILIHKRYVIEDGFPYCSRTYCSQTQLWRWLVTFENCCKWIKKSQIEIDDRDSNPGMDMGLHLGQHVWTDFETHPVTYPMSTIYLSPGVKWPGREAPN